MADADRPNPPQSAELARLEDAREWDCAVAKMGTVPQRAAVGDRARGLQRERRCVELLPARSRPIARLPLGRGRARGVLRSEAAAVFRAGAVERQRSDPEGAAVRPEQRPGQSRRGREGVLLLSRFHADPLVHEVALQVSARGVPLRGSDSRPTRIARGTTTSTSSSTPASSTTTATLTWSSNMRSRRRRNASSRSRSTNRGPEPAAIHLLPTLWFRNTWSWWPDKGKPHLAAEKGPRGTSVVKAWHPELGDRWLYCDGAAALLFTENDTNRERIFNAPNESRYVKDAFHACVVHGDAAAVNAAGTGTKAAAHYRLDVGAGQSVSVRLRLTDASQTRPVYGVRRNARRQAPRGRRVLPVLHA